MAAADRAWAKVRRSCAAALAALALKGCEAGSRHVALAVLSALAWRGAGGRSRREDDFAAGAVVSGGASGGWMWGRRLSALKVHEAAAWPPCLALADRLLVGGVSSGPGGGCGGEAEAGELLWGILEALIFAPPAARGRRLAGLWWGG